jgi:hypothetical protein
MLELKSFADVEGLKNRSPESRVMRTEYVRIRIIQNGRLIKSGSSS